MALYLGYDSAVEFWRSKDLSLLKTLEPCRARRVGSEPPDRGLVVELSWFVVGEVSIPLHVMVSDPSYRRSFRGVVCHTCQSALPDRSFWRLGDDYRISSPELCFAQMASSLSLPRLVCLGFELCGSYALAESASSGFWQREPITTVRRIGLFLGKLSGMKGSRKAQRAIRYVLDGSASPMETALAMLLSLPVSLGGYGLPAPQLNAHVDLGDESRAALGKRFVVCDLYWPAAHVAVEYDSDAFHTGADRIASDARRRNALQHNGVTVITVTKDQLLNYRKFESSVRQIAQAIGKKERRSAFAFDEKKARLRSELLPAQGAGRF